jgi:hypothetical protein
MPSTFDSDFDAADELLAEVFGTTVTLTRQGSTDEDEVTAEAVERSVTVQDEQSGLPIVLHARAYLIAVADYAFDGTAVEPRQGDRIVETINGTQYEFEVSPVGGFPAAAWADAAGRRWLINTNKVS